PRAPTVSAGRAVSNLGYRTICEGLYQFDARSQVAPWLAAALPSLSADKLTYTVRLREGIVFNDGTPFNAQAVVISLQRDITLPGSMLARSLASVESITATGPYTVAIHLTNRDASLPGALAGGAGLVMSPTQLAKLGDNFSSDPVCVGPFMFDNRVLGASITVVKSPYYYDKYAVHLDKIVFVPQPDAAAGVAALEAGDFQV